MNNERIVNFTTCVRNSGIYDDRVIKLLIGFVPTEDEQTSLKEDALETAAIVDEPTEKYPDIFGSPEVQKAITEMKQNPSLFQRIKNWFAN